VYSEDWDVFLDIRKLFTSVVYSKDSSRASKLSKLMSTGGVESTLVVSVNDQSLGGTGTSHVAERYENLHCCFRI